MRKKRIDLFNKMFSSARQHAQRVAGASHQLRSSRRRGACRFPHVCVRTSVRRVLCVVCFPYRCARSIQLTLNNSIELLTIQYFHTFVLRMLYVLLHTNIFNCWCNSLLHLVCSLTIECEYTNLRSKF